MIIKNAKKLMKDNVFTYIYIYKTLKIIVCISPAFSQWKNKIYFLPCYFGVVLISLGNLLFFAHIQTGILTSQ